ncbi:PHD finger protein At1g33420-like [Chenopodium quinoa]|uniref:Zinc finger PHD-type domain-containing protein n=1 Tax=Chenopodium quinoa TaxID=63459 RepID=A0A803L521_CHEQI|nr:PHD finger protein At1g33420-like [Chenopodium quinoa]
MVVNARSLKRMKRRVTAEFPDFLSFPAPGSGQRIAGAPFRSNIKAFLARHALLPPPSSLLPHLVTWQVLFRAGDSPESPVNSSPPVVCVDVVEEDVARSRSVYCDQCRVVGWSGHPVCTKRYHFIIKADGNSIGGFVKPCPKCGDSIHLADPRCKTCQHVMTSDETEDWVYNQLEDTTHLLHGVVHANGYGHLLRVNGREGGSRVLSGTDIMDFWDRLCKYLGVRKISVMDVSKKYGMEYRLLHAITKGHPWYGNWGYEFGSGSFALTQDSYRDAVETLSNLPLSFFICQGRKPRTHIQDLIFFYQSLSECELVNMRDLFYFVMSLVHDVQKSSLVSEDSFKKRRSCAPGVLCAWTTSDIKRVEAAMIRVLRAVTGSKWVSWRTLRGAVCKVGSPELLDYCLKELGGKQTPEGMIVHARCNPNTGALEYRVESGNFSLLGSSGCTYPSSLNYPSREKILQDMRFLYENLLHPLTMMTFGPKGRRECAVSAASRLLDCKQFVKNYKPETTLSPENPSAILIYCQVELPEYLSEEHTIRPPPELIVLPLKATISDLKVEASKVFQEVYIMLKGFQAEELVDYRGVEDSTQVRLLFPSLLTVRIRGRCPLKNGLGRFRSERGVERWTVECGCGAHDDDGERMLACDGCGVWQHTRCAGILDSEAVPAKFLCIKCGGTSQMAIDNVGLNCKDESIMIGGGGGKSLAMLFDVR